VKVGRRGEKKGKHAIYRGKEENHQRKRGITSLTTYSEKTISFFTKETEEKKGAHLLPVHTLKKIKPSNSSTRGQWRGRKKGERGARNTPHFPRLDRGGGKLPIP